MKTKTLDPYQLKSEHDYKYGFMLVPLQNGDAEEMVEMGKGF